MSRPEPGSGHASITPMSDQAGNPAPGGPGRGQVPGLDTRHAHPARVYNYWLGGKDNYPADREAAEAAIAANPRIVTDVRANRAFLARVVRYLAADCGIRQFLDIGTGLPTASNTHEVAQAAAPDARVVYVDNDPIVLSHARAHPASDIRAAEMAEMTRRVNERMSGPTATMRDRAAITHFFDELDLLEPGVVQPQQWRPDPGALSPPQVTAWCGVARKP